MEGILLFIPSFVFVLVYLIYLVFPPKRINHLYGYRTPRSMSSQEMWELANAYFHKKAGFFAIVHLVISGALSLSPISFDKALITTIVLMIASLILIIVLTERALKKHES